MNFNIKQIIEGWRNDLLPPDALKETILTTSEERLKICRACSYNSVNKQKLGEKFLRKDEHCTACGCPLIKKTKCLSCQCPLEPPKWTRLIEKEEDTEDIKQISNEGL